MFAMGCDALYETLREQRLAIGDAVLKERKK